MIPAGLAAFTAQALVPEHIQAYVRAVSGRRALACASCIAYAGEDDLVLVGYPLHDPRDSAALDEAVERALAVLPPGGRLTVLAASLPSAAPPEAAARGDDWWFLDLPPPPAAQKTRNMLRRAGREARVLQSCGRFDAAHMALVHAQMSARPLTPGTRLIYSRLPDYLASSPGALLFSAYSLETDELIGCAVGEYGALATAFYLFAFRARRAPPGTADLLLDAVLREAEARGHRRCSLGLGINDGIGFFKRKYGARPGLPCLECSWIPRPAGRRSWLQRLFR